MGALGDGADRSCRSAGQAVWVIPELSDGSHIHTRSLNISSVVLGIPGNTVEDITGEAPRSDACHGTS